MKFTVDACTWEQPKPGTVFAGGIAYLHTVDSSDSVFEVEAKSRQHAAQKVADLDIIDTEQLVFATPATGSFRFLAVAYRVNPDTGMVESDPDA